MVGKRKDNNVKSSNNNLNLPEGENKEMINLKEEKNTNDMQGEKINNVQEKNNNEINDNLSIYNIKEENKEILKNKKMQNAQFVLKNEESLKIINNCLIKEQQPLKELEKSIESPYKVSKHKPFDYPIYPYDSDDPEGF